MGGYSLITIARENYQRVISSTSPLYLPLGAISGADIGTIKVVCICSAFSGTSASLDIQESYDGGASWTSVPDLIDDTVNGTGTFSVAVSATTGPISPVLRLVVSPNGATLVYLSSVQRTFIQSDTPTLRDVSLPSGLATEVTLLAAKAVLDNIKTDTGNIDTDIGLIEGHISTIDTNVGTINTNVGLIKDWAKDSGATSATTLRTVLATRHETVTTPLAARLSDGTDFIVAEAIAAAQKTVSTAAKALDTISLVLGYDGVNTHREILTDTNGALRLAAADIASLTTGDKPEYAKAIVPVLHNFAVSGITTGGGVYTTVIASTAAKAIRWQFSNTSSSFIVVAYGTGPEVPFCYIPPGGAVEVDINIAASSKISVYSDENVAAGKLSVAAFV